MDFQLTDIWTAAGVLLGFQVTSFAWRVDREVKVGEEGDLTWLPPADFLNLVSMMIVVGGVFTLPILGLVDLIIARILFGLALILFVGYPFALAGHYDMYNNKTPRSYNYWPMQERVIFAIIFVIAIAYAAFALL
jgi:hypothetical protein